MMLQAPHPDWLRPTWPPAATAAGIQGLITTRAGGVGTGALGTCNLRHTAQEAREITLANRARLRASLPAAPCWLQQVHGVDVLDVDRWTIADTHQADAAVTACPGVVLALLTADCLPVLLCDPGAGVLGVAHAGWRGLAAGVLETTVAAMLVKGAQAERVLAYVGPAISAAAYTVGPDVVTAFVGDDSAALTAFEPLPVASGQRPTYRCDLLALARLRLARAGVHAVASDEHCTFGEAARFYSHRRDPASGRMASLIWRQLP